MISGGMPSRVAGHIWKCKVPLKIKFFLWQIFNNKLQCAASLVKRGWKGDIDCCLGDGRESVDHIFFGCRFAKMVWGFMKEICWNTHPHSVKDLSETWLLGKGPLPIRLILFVFAGFAWALWNNRNKMSIEHKFPKSPSDIMYIALSFMQKWSLLLKEDNRQRITQIKDEVLRWMRSFMPMAMVSTDIYEI